MGSRLSLSQGQVIPWILTLMAGLQLAACGEKAHSPATPAPPKLAVERVVGTYVGSMLTRSGVEAVVLVIQGVEPSQKGFLFQYRINTRHLREDGIGQVRTGDRATLICFDSSVCGSLALEGGRVLITGDTGPHGTPLVWVLEKL